ncbi:MAG TPA: glycosyltransferase family 9 protein [Vicinamibacterales bacterium]|nr:glycosyltransferase family 9 protein [Vicinamibacterales bacterium]
MLVGLADLAIAPAAWLQPRRPSPDRIRRVLLMRLERIGDLLMVLDAIRDARTAWPDAEIDLAVGSWNVPIARLIPEVTRVEVADAPWLARANADVSVGALLARAHAWRRHHYDVVVNFEPDIRSNFLAWLTGAPRRFGYWTGGGGRLLTDADTYAPTTHVSVNARQLIARATGRPSPTQDQSTAAHLIPSPEAAAAADKVLQGRPGPLIGVHASGGRESKQWHLDRFAAVARKLAETRNATIVLTGAPGDRPLVDAVRRGLEGVPMIDASGTLDLPALGALLARLDLLITGDTGPMHLAAAVGTPLVALFGPSNPLRYGPLGIHQRILRIDLPCSPCGRVRLPPKRCRGHVPDCLDGISVDTVVAAANDLLDTTPARRPPVVV